MIYYNIIYIYAHNYTEIARCSTTTAHKLLVSSPLIVARLPTLFLCVMLRTETSR